MAGYVYAKTGKAFIMPEVSDPFHEGDAVCSACGMPTGGNFQTVVMTPSACPYCKAPFEKMVVMNKDAVKVLIDSGKVTRV